MPIINCDNLLQVKKTMEPKRMAMAVVNHVLPMVLDLESKFLLLIKQGLPTEVPIFTYQETRLLVDGDTIVDEYDTKVSTLAYESCTILACGTRIGEATSGRSALELLSTAIGPNIRVFKKTEQLNTRPYFTVHRVTLVARLEDKPLKRSTRAVELWPFAEYVIVKDGLVVWPEGACCCDTDDLDTRGSRWKRECNYCGLERSACTASQVQYIAMERRQQYHARWQDEWSKRRCQERCSVIKEDLMAEFWKPERLEKLLEQGGWELVDSY